MSKELTIEYISHTAVALAKERSKECLYQITTEVKDGHECIIAVVTPFQRPFPSIAYQSDDETMNVRIKSIGGNVVTLSVFGNPGPVIVYMRVVDGTMVATRFLPT
jgi:hypothetical protein